MATVAEVNALLAQYDSIIETALSQLGPIVDQMAAISPTDPNAASTLASLESQYQSIRSQAQTQARAVYAQYSAAYDSLTPQEKQQADNSPEAAHHKQVAEQAASNQARHQTVYDSKNAEIKAAQTATPAPTTAAPVTGPAATGNTKPGLVGAASDDSGAKQPNPAGTTGAPVTAPPGTKPAGSQTGTGGATTPTSTGKAPDSETKAGAGSGYKYQASVISKQPISLASQPGKRLDNPLGEFSSYTYQITLYMMTPDAYTAFALNGRTKINILSEASGGASKGGAFVIAQSGGISKSDLRAPGFDFDYGIDNLVIKHAVTGKATGGPNNVTEVTFNITEPYGFSFLSNLRKASDAIRGPENPSRQFFVLGIKFLGYDASGRPMLPNTKMSSGSGVVDPLSQNGALFEYFIDISINMITFKIDGKAVTYRVEATQTSQGKGLSTSRGFVQTQHTVEAGTVGEMLDQLMVQLNEEQDKLSKGTPPSLSIPNKYEIIWLPGTEDILNASLISPARLEKSRWAGSGAKTVAESNEHTATTTQAANDTKKNFPFPGGKSIIQSINDVILQSTFLEDALSVLYTSAPEADPKTKSNPKVKSTATSVFKWYSCTPQITEIKWDELTKDWAYKISYIIQKYDVPALDVPFAAGGKPYPGPVKRYDYWYTGKNNNIIKYEQQMDNTYFNTVLSVGDAKGGAATPEVGNADNKLGSGSTTPTQPNMQPNQPRQGSTGYGLAVQNSFMTSLYDPAAYASANITILGDPDFLTSEPSYSVEQVYDQFYGSNGFSINANGGQVFIEVDFKEGVDYTSSTGTLNINDSILFWQYPPEVADKIKGVSYQVITCDSVFQNGTFKQTLGCVIQSFGDSKQQIGSAKAGAEAAKSNSSRDASETASQFAGQGPTSVNDALTSDVAGTVTEKPVDTKNNVQQAGNAAPATKTTATPTTPTGPGGAPVAADKPAPAPSVPPAGRDKTG